MMTTYAQLLTELKNLECHKTPPELTEKRPNSDNSGSSIAAHQLNSVNSGAPLHFSEFLFHLLHEDPDWSQIELLADDRKWLSDMLIFTPRDTVESLVDEYRAIWLKTMAKTKGAHKKQNAGRFAANTWLRQHLKKC